MRAKKSIVQIMEEYEGQTVEVDVVTVSKLMTLLASLGEMVGQDVFGVVAVRVARLSFEELAAFSLALAERTGKADEKDTIYLKAKLEERTATA